MQHLHNPPLPLQPQMAAGVKMQLSKRSLLCLTSHSIFTQVVHTCLPAHQSHPYIISRTFLEDCYDWCWRHRSREKMWKILWFLDISDTSKSSSSSLVLSFMVHGIAIRICSTSEKQSLLEHLLCFAQHAWRTALIRDTNINTTVQEIISLQVVDDLTKCIYSMLDFCVPNHTGISNSNMNTTSDHNDIHQMNNTWFTLKHLPKLSRWYGFILCPRKSQQLHKENGDVLNHRPAVVETQYVYLYTPNDIWKIMILIPTILHEPTNESFLNTTPSVAFRMSFQRRYQHDTFPTREIWNKLQTQEPFLIHTPHGGNNYTQSIVSPPSLNQSPVTSNIHCWWW